MAQLSLSSGAVLILCFVSAARCQVDGWKPIVGTTSYSRLTQHLPSATINVENGDSIGENSVTFHGAAGAEDPILSVGGGPVVDGGTEGRFLGDISSDYGGSSAKAYNGLYSSGGVSVFLSFSFFRWIWFFGAFHGLSGFGASNFGR